jgi:RNA polymerase sigma factor (sigma-70 family)
MAKAIPEVHKVTTSPGPAGGYFGEAMTAEKQPNFEEQLAIHKKDIVKIAELLNLQIGGRASLDDLVADGIIGFYKSFLKHDGERDIMRFAHRRIRGEMIDGLRRNAWIVKTRGKRFYIPSYEIPKDFFVLSPKEHYDDMIVIEKFMRRCFLSAFERYAVMRHYLDGKTLEEIAGEIGLSSSRMSQVIKKAKDKIRRFLSP